MHVLWWCIWIQSNCWLCMATRQSKWSVMYVCEIKRKTEEERGSLSPPKSAKNSRSLCPVKRFMSLSIGCVPVRPSVHAHTQRCQWAFMSMFKLSIWNTLSLWGKWTKQTDSSQLKSWSIIEQSQISTEAKSTNNVLTHKAICRLDETTYQIAYAKMAIACAERDMSTARDKIFNTSNYEDNGQKIEM